VYHIDRGYERIEQRLQQLGASIERVDDRVTKPDDDTPIAQVEIPRRAAPVRSRPAAASRSRGTPKPKRAKAKVFARSR
jgi:hypothetical protein